MRVMERIAAALSCNEPVLLVGETGASQSAAVQLSGGLRDPLAYWCRGSPG
jgi:midasin (ATPase involved in ribosome maturation)